MSQLIYATGKQIYEAAVAGAKRGYNRSTDDYYSYEEIISEHYKAMLEGLKTRAQRRLVQKHTGNDWRKAYLPLSLALVHKHIGGQECEEHARVYLITNPFCVFDIPMSDWNAMSQNFKHLRK